MKTGIDVSGYQGVIDWSKVVTDFVMIRAGWSWYEGGMNIDKMFENNTKGVIANNLPWGVYLYAYDKSVSAAITAATMLCDMLDKGKYDLSYPVAYDFEDTQYLKTGKEINTEICNAFLSVVKNRGYYPMLYTYTNFAKSYLNMDRLKEYDFWVADYTGKVGWNDEYAIWQVGNNGKISGISTDVDINYAYKDYPKIIQEMKNGGVLSGISKNDKDKLLAMVDETESKLSEIREYIDNL